MTPTAHAAAADDLLAQVDDRTNANVHLPHDELLATARVHALLAVAPGTGTHYTAAEALLARVEAPTNQGGVVEPRRQLLDAAAVHAHLARINDPTERNTMTTTTTMTTPTLPTLPLVGGDRSLNLIHRSRNPSLLAALEAVPAWADARARLLLLLEETKPPPWQVGDVDDQLAALVTAGLSSGKGVPANLTKQAGQMRADRLAHQAVEAAIDRARGWLAIELDDAVRGAEDVCYAHLHDELQLLVAAVSELGNLHELRTAEGALSRDRGEDWQTFTRLTGQYRDIRAAQGLLLRHVTDWAPESGEDVTRIANLVEVFPDYLAWRRKGFVTDSQRRRTLLSAPWPENTQSSEFLAWLATSNAEPWVPTPDQLAEADTRVMATADDAVPMVTRNASALALNDYDEEAS